MIFDERNKRWEAACVKQAEAIAAQGFTTISCLAFHDPRSGERLMSTWLGATKQVLLTNAPVDAARYGIGRVLVAKDSTIVDVPATWTWSAVELEAVRLNAVILTVFV